MKHLGVPGPLRCVTVPDVMTRTARSVSAWFAKVIGLLIAVQFLGVLPVRAQQTDHDRVDVDYPGARAAWFAAGRQNPAGSSQPRAWHYLHAWQHAQIMPRLIPGAGRGQASGRMAAHTATLAGNWKELGPRPENSGQYGAVAGRVTAIAVDNGKDPSGNTVYLGTAYGGLWKSTNALSATPTFSPIGDTMPTLAVGAIALDSSTSPTTIYVGTGEPNASADSYYGVGILKSIDGGQTWTKVSSDTNGNTFFGLTWSRILVDPVNPEIVLAAASYSGAYVNQGNSLTVSGLFVSINGGKTFMPRITGPSCTDIVYDSQTHTYYAVFAGNGIQSSINQGATWKPVTSPFANRIKPSSTNFARASLAMRNGVLSVLIAGPDSKISTPTVCPATVTATTSCDTGLAQSSDGGKTWTPVAIPGSKPSTSTDSLFCADPKNCQGNYDQYVAMPSGTNDLVIGGIDAFRLSGGSGLSAAWTNLTQSYGSGTVHPDEHTFASNADGSVWFIGDDGGIWRSTDKGASWTNLNSSLGVIQFISVSADLGQNGVYFGGSQDNGTAIADPTNKLLWNLIWGGDGGYTFDNPAQTQQYFTENPGFFLFRSDDGGQNFVDVVDNHTITDPAEFYVPYDFSADFTQAYVATTKVWKGPANPSSPGAGWKAISGDLTGQNCNSRELSSVLSAIAVAPGDANTIYTGSSTGTLSASTNAVSASPTWQNWQASCSHPVSAIAVDPTNPQIAYATLQGFLGPGAGHVYATTNGGQSWTMIGSGLPDVPVNSIVVDPDTPENLFIGTDSGVFVTSDGGADAATHPVKWSLLGSGLPATAVLQLKLARENGAQTLIAATHGRGAWAIPAAAPPNFLLSTDQATYYAPVTDSQTQFPLHVHVINGNNAPIHLDCLPQNGATCSLSADTVSASGDVTVTVGWTAGTAGYRSIQISGDDGANQSQVSPAVITQDFQLNASNVNTLNLEYGSSVDIPVQLVTSYGWNGTITLACPGLPAGFSCTANPAKVSSIQSYSNPQVTVTLNASASASAQSPLQVSIAAASDALTRTATVPVNVAHFSLSVPSSQVNVIAGAASLTTTVTASSKGNSTEPITLACQSPVSTIQCSFNPAVMQPGQSSTVTVSGTALATGTYTPNDQFSIRGTSGSDTVLSAPVNVNVQDFKITGVLGQSLVGADTAHGTIQYFSWGGYAASVTLSCTADQGVQCSVPTPVVNGSNTAEFVLTGLKSLPTGTAVHVTVQASNGDLQRTGSGTVTIDDFAIHPANTALAQPPGYAKSSTILSLDSSPGGLNPQTAFSCNAAAGIVCTFTSYSPMQAYLTVDTTQYLQGGGTLPANVQISVSATQSGTTVTHTITLPVEAQDFSLSGPTDPVIVTAGQSADFTVKLSTGTIFQEPVQFRCDGAPAGSTCAAQETAWVPGLATFHLTTTARGQARSGGKQARVIPPVVSHDDWPHAAPEVAVGIVGLLLWLAGWSMTEPRRRRILLQYAGIGCLLMALAGCGGGGGGGYTPPSGGGTPVPTGTPAGTSTLTITAYYTDTTAPLGPVTVSHQTKVTLTVQ